MVALATLGLLVYGVLDLKKLPIDAQPDITNNQVQIITVAPSLGATDIERLITFPIELAHRNIKGIEEVRSLSRFGLSLVTIVFDDDTDIYWARQQVSERLQTISNEIPAEIGVPEMGPISTGLGEIYQYVIKPKKGYESKYDPTELRSIQDWIVRRELLSVKGVAEVSSFGGKLKQYEVAIQSESLSSYNLSIADLLAAVESNNENTGGAYIEKGPKVLYIRTEGLTSSLSDIENSVVSQTKEGTPILVRDIAQVKLSHAIRYGAMTYNGEREVAGAIVMMLKGAKSNEVIAQIKDKIEEIQKTLPEGLEIEAFLDRSKLVDSTIGTIQTNLLEGALIVIFILVLFLGNLRAGLIVATVIPLSLLFSIILMNIFGVDGNLMSLGALDFGLIVDGAVIIVEATLHQLLYVRLKSKDKKEVQKTMDSEVSSASKRMVNSAVFGQMIILIVYLPILSLQGIEGKMFKPMAMTVAFALIGAFILSLTYIPMMSALFLKVPTSSKKNFSDRMMTVVEKVHQKYLLKSLKHPVKILAVVFALFVFALFTLFRMGGEFIPSLEEGDFAVETRIMPGSNIEKTIEYTNKAATLLKKEYPEITSIVTKIGSAEIPTEPMPMDAGDMIIVLKPKKEWVSASTFPELAKKMSATVEQIPGISTGFQFPVQMRFNELMTGARQDIVCKIFGEDLDVLAESAQQLGGIIDQVKGSQDLYIEPITGIPQIVVTYKREAMARYGVSVQEVNKFVQVAFAGLSTGKVYEGERKFDLVVRLDKQQRTEIRDVENLLIPTLGGAFVPLEYLADVKEIDSPNQIQREGAKRRIIVAFNVRDRDIESTVKELQQKVSSQIHLPPGYQITYGGAFENLEKAKDRLVIAVPVSLVLILLLLYFAFNSIKYSLLIYTAIPLSSIGGILLLAARGIPFSISAGVGFIALFGVSVLNGIVLISEYERLKKSGVTSLYRRIMVGTKTRLRPVLMTATVASLGFLPMALSSGSGAEVQRPLATVVIGGLLLATFLTLFVLPILYALVDSFSFFRKYKTGLTILLIGLSYTSSLDAQQPITLNAAIDSALQNNLNLQNKALVSAFFQQRMNTFRDVPPLSIDSEWGQINGAKNDAKFGISQSIQFPQVYTQLKKSLQANWDAAVQDELIEGIDIRRRVSLHYSLLLNAQLKKDWLLKTIAEMDRFEKKAKNRFELGEGNALEYLSAQNQMSQLDNQLRSIEALIQTLSLELQFWMNSKVNYLATATEELLSIHLDRDTLVLEDHPQLRYLDQLIASSEALYRYEKAKYFPQIELGYYNQSMRDLDQKRYSSVQLGLQVPLLFSAQKAQVRSSKVKLEIAENEKQILSLSLQQQYRQLISTQENLLKIYQNFREAQLHQASQLLALATLQFDKGDIDYFQWLLIYRQAMDIQLAYLDAVEALNNNSIAITYFISKN